MKKLFRERTLAGWLFVQMQNATHYHERLMALFLQRRGWVVFYLEEYARNCHDQGTCWLELYKSASVNQNSEVGLDDR